MFWILASFLNFCRGWTMKSSQVKLFHFGLFMLSREHIHPTWPCVLPTVRFVTCVPWVLFSSPYLSTSCLFWWRPNLLLDESAFSPTFQRLYFTYQSGTGSRSGHFLEVLVYACISQHGGQVPGAWMNILWRRKGRGRQEESEKEGRKRRFLVPCRWLMKSVVLAKSLKLSLREFPFFFSFVQFFEA